MKIRKILAILCCMVFTMSLAGCFPFNLMQDFMPNNQSIGGSDGPTSVMVVSEEPESISEEESESEYEFDFQNFNDLTTEEDSEPSYPNLEAEFSTNAVAWYDVYGEDVMWLFSQNYALLYEDVNNYYIASYDKYYNEDAVNYVASELSSYGLTEEEQLEAMTELDEDDNYFCIVFSEISVYEDGTYAGRYEEDILAYIGFEYLNGDTIYHDMIRMDTQDTLSFYSHEKSATDTTANTEYQDTQRIGSVENGYTDVPADYVEFIDPSLPDGFIQYSDATGTNIVTLGHYNDEISAKAYASSMLLTLEQDPYIDQSSVTSATVTLDGCEAYQVYGYYPDDYLFLVIWFLDSPEDDGIHYISVEFSSYAVFQMVEDTYHVAY